MWSYCHTIQCGCIPTMPNPVCISHHGFDDLSLSLPLSVHTKPRPLSTTPHPNALPSAGGLHSIKPLIPTPFRGIDCARHAGGLKGGQCTSHLWWVVRLSYWFRTPAAQPPAPRARDQAPSPTGHAIRPSTASGSDPARDRPPRPDQRT